MGESIGYQSAAVYVPQSSVLTAQNSQQAARERSDNPVTSSGIESDNSSDMAIGTKVEAAGAGLDNFGEPATRREDQAPGQAINRDNQVQAQELAGDAKGPGAVAGEAGTSNDAASLYRKTVDLTA